MGAEHFEGVTVQPMINWTGYELIVGSSPDPQFGPVLLFGMGGQLVEVVQGPRPGLPPLNTTLAPHLIDETTISQALKGVRGRRPIDKDVLAELLVRFSELVAEQPRIAEIDINPLLASPERIIALDARVVLHPPTIADADLPRLAIRPYPHEYERRPRPTTACDGSGRSGPRTSPRWSASTPGCRPRRSSPGTARTGRSRSARPHERMTRICFADYDRQFALVVEAGAKPRRCPRSSRSPGCRGCTPATIATSRWSSPMHGSGVASARTSFARR